MFNQSFLAKYSSNATDKMTYDGTSSFVFTIKHGFKAAPSDTTTYEASWQAITDNTYTNGELDSWQVLTITPDLDANGPVKFNITDGTNNYETREIDMDGRTTLRLWVYFTDLTTEAGVEILAQAV